MMKRIIIGLIAIGGAALGCTDASAQCNGVGTGGSCKTGGLLGRSLVGITRTLEPGTTTFEFFGAEGPGCTHNFSAGKLDCDCRLKGTAYCTTPTATSFTASTSNGNGGAGDDDGARLKPKSQTLAAGLQVITAQPIATSSTGGNSGGSDSFWTVAEVEPDFNCVSCPSGASQFVTFIAKTVVMRDTFCPDSEGPCQTTIRSCTGGGKLSPTTNIGSYNCQTVFECEGGACPVTNTIGTCGATCEGGG